jgi:branched-chain amino acid transport system permease protein
MMAMATVAVAGVFLAMRTTFTPSSGPDYLIFAFEAVVIGGIGSVRGTLAGGLVLGVAQTVGAQINAADPILIGHLVFLAVLVLRPRGLFRSSALA